MLPNAAVYYDAGKQAYLERRVEEAEAYFRAALEREPQVWQTHVMLSAVLLLTGRTTEAYREYEWRLNGPGSDVYRIWEKDFGPYWRGESLNGKALVVGCDQGRGDALQYVRLLPIAKKRAQASRLHLHCPFPELTPLLRHSPGVDSVERPKAGSTGAFCALESLLHLLNVEESTIPKPLYLIPRQAVIHRWQRSLATYPGVNVGICWAGGADNPSDPYRTPPVDIWRSLSDVAGVTYFDLTVRREPSLPLPHTRLAPLLTDYEETAGAILAMDLVITVDTSVCHLAGGLGKPVWTLLGPYHDPRWRLERADTPWYPSMTLFRQPEPGAWGPMIETVCDRLRRRLA